MSNVTLLRQSNDGGNRTPRLKRSHDAESGDGDTLVLQGISKSSQHRTATNIFCKDTNIISATPQKKAVKGKENRPQEVGETLSRKNV